MNLQLRKGAFIILQKDPAKCTKMFLDTSAGLNFEALKSVSNPHLIGLDLGGDASVVDDLRRQKVKLDVGVCDARPTSDEASTLQVGCGSVTYEKVIAVKSRIVCVCKQRGGGTTS